MRCCVLTTSGITGPSSCVGTTWATDPAISNAVYGEVPFGIEVVPAESITKHLRQTNLQNLNAGVFSGASVPLQRPLGNELVSSLHQSLQGRSGR